MNKLMIILPMLLLGCISPSHYIDEEFTRSDQLDLFAERVDLIFYDADQSDQSEVIIYIRVNGFGNQFRKLAVEIAGIHGYQFSTWGEEKMGLIKMNFVRKTE